MLPDHYGYSTAACGKFWPAVIMEVSFLLYIYCRFLAQVEQTAEELALSALTPIGVQVFERPHCIRGTANNTMAYFTPNADLSSGRSGTHIRRSSGCQKDFASASVPQNFVLVKPFNADRTSHDFCTWLASFQDKLTYTMSNEQPYGCQGV